ncbi:hypothetical protein K2Z83_21090 [Oscillochloris sp. ZM17-4]|uniref:hypothetical protein n=1 Tax=Oscillochloris sp. ZM17-4 TaxID=2866714 RepID=UPI001C730757|nr:hypothetical protein [Oscillochloris sp. ZM17-4]MBX0330168.1 hypothetical protein [Oscillochloris sp. ZM17-4]
MLHDDRAPTPTTGAILFTIPAPAVAAYRTWRASADLDYLRGFIERQGWAWVVRMGDGEWGMRRIETLPELGVARPRYGTIGGGFPFIFRPHRGGCTLTVEAPSLFILSLPPDQMVIPTVTAPFAIAIDPIAILDEPLSIRDSRGILDEMPDEPDQPWRFGLAGEALRELLGWGWDRAVPGAYRYIFMPTDVGCAARVADGYGGEIDVTGDMNM